MEVSTPVKIIEGNTDVLGVTVGTVPGAGECAIITSSSGISTYSMVNRTVAETWTFPSNRRECITSPAYVMSEEGCCIMDSESFLVVLLHVKVRIRSFSGKAIFLPTNNLIQFR